MLDSLLHEEVTLIFSILDYRSPKLVQCGLLHCVTSLRLLLMSNKKGKHALQCKNIIQIMFYHIIIPLKKETIIHTCIKLLKHKKGGSTCEISSKMTHIISIL